MKDANEYFLNVHLRDNERREQETREAYTDAYHDAMEMPIADLVGDIVADPVKLLCEILEKASTTGVINTGEFAKTKLCELYDCYASHKAGMSTN
jgi:hypothetical protein